MKKILALMLGICLALLVVSCVSGNTKSNKSDVPTASTISSETSIDDKLIEIQSYIIGDIWNDAFCNIRDYILTGKDSTGETMDIDLTLQKLDDAIPKKAGYNDFINSLEDEKYTRLKQYWQKLSAETDKMYNQIKTTKPVANDEKNELDTGLFVQYREAFTDECDALRE